MDRADDISTRVAKGHAVDKHLHEFDELEVKTADQYRQHVKSVLRDPEVEGFTAYTTAQTHRQADIFYHKKTNTIVIDPANRAHEPTAYRPKNGEKTFLAKHRTAQRIENRSIEKVNGLEALQGQKKNQGEEDQSKQELTYAERERKKRDLQKPQGKSKDNVKGK